MNKEELKKEHLSLNIEQQIIWDTMSAEQQGAMREQFEINADWWLSKIDQAVEDKVKEIRGAIEALPRSHYYQNRLCEMMGQGQTLFREEDIFSLPILQINNNKDIE